MIRSSIFILFREYISYVLYGACPDGCVSKYPSGGLNLNAGHFSQLSRRFLYPFSAFIHVNSSRIDVSRTNCISILFLSVRSHFLSTATVLTLRPPLISNIGSVTFPCGSLASFWLRALCFRPPRGRFSHLAMFRIGSLLFIPAYLTVIMYRVFANSNDEGNLVLMAGEHFFITW